MAPELHPYATYDSILKAVSSGKKPIWRDDWMLSNIEAGDPDFGKYLRKALEHGLAVTIVEPRWKVRHKNWCPEVYLLKLEETWRISALHALRETAWTRVSQWSYPNEAHESLLLGYTTNQRAAWLAAQHRRGLRASGKTVYALLTPPQRKTVISVGQRCSARQRRRME